MRQIVDNIRIGLWLAVEIALDQLAAFAQKGGGLKLGFHALGDNLDSKVAADAQHGRG